MNTQETCSATLQLANKLQHEWITPTHSYLQQLVKKDNWIEYLIYGDSS